MARKPQATIAKAALCALFAIACSEGGSVDVLESVPAWTAELDLRIGSVDDPDYTLTSIRQLEASPDGRIYALHPVEQVVRSFHADGTPAARIGGRGDGPGEFQNAIAMGWVADTLWVLDASGYRFNQFSPEGAYLGSFAVPFRAGDDPRAAQPPRARGLLFDGTVHGAPPAFSRMIADGTLTQQTLLLMTRGGEVTDTVASIPFGTNAWAISDPDAPRQPQMHMDQPFADGPLWAFSVSERAVTVLERPAPETGPGAEFHVSKLDPEGDTMFAREYSTQAIPVAQEEVDSILDAVAESLSSNDFFNVTAARARQLGEGSLYRPAFKPPVTDMVLGKDGSIWLRQEPDGRGTVTWLVLGAQGEATARLQLPAGADLHVIDPPYLWGTETDELDVPYVVRFSLSPNRGYEAAGRQGTGQLPR